MPPRDAGGLVSTPSVSAESHHRTIIKSHLRLLKQALWARWSPRNRGLLRRKALTKGGGALPKKPCRLKQPKSLTLSR